MSTRTAWAIKWRTVSRLDGDTDRFQGRYQVGLPDVPDHVAGNSLLLFKTREKAREYIRAHWGYLKNRPDLRREPFGWRMPRPVKVLVSVQEVGALS